MMKNHITVKYRKLKGSGPLERALKNAGNSYEKRLMNGLF